MGNCRQNKRCSMIGASFGNYASSGVSGFDPAASAIIAQMTANGSTPSEARQVIINQLVLDLKGLGNTGGSDIWSKLDILQIYAAEDEIQSLTEWRVGNGTYDATIVNSPTFTADVGYYGFVFNNRVECNWSPNEGLGNFTQNSASFGAIGTAAQYFCGTPSTYQVYIRATVTASDQSLNNAGFPSGTWGASGQNHYLLNRDNSANFDMILNGVLVDTVTATSSALSSTMIAGPTINSFSANTVNIIYMGGDMGGDTLQLHNSFNAYLSSL